MFLPTRIIQLELQEKQRQYRRVEELVNQLLPTEYQTECTISVQEVQCGDPQCAPIDTVVTILFERYVLSLVALLLTCVSTLDHRSVL